MSTCPQKYDVSQFFISPPSPPPPLFNVDFPWTEMLWEAIENKPLTFCSDTTLPGGGRGGECEPRRRKYVNVGFVTTIVAMIVV